MALVLPKATDKIPTRSGWREIRTKAKGKKGLAKVNLGEAIDKFHTAYTTAYEKKYVGDIWTAIDALVKTVTTYMSDLEKLPNGATTYKDLITAVKDNLTTKLTDLRSKVSTASEQYAEEVRSARTSVESCVKSAKLSFGKVTELVNQIPKDQKQFLPLVPQFVKAIGHHHEEAEQQLTKANKYLMDYKFTDPQTAKPVEEAQKELKFVKSFLEKLKNMK